MITRYTSTLPPTKIKSDQHAALQRLAEKDQTTTSHLTRLAIAEYLERRASDVAAITA